MWLNMNSIVRCASPMLSQSSSFDVDHFKDVNDTYGHIVGDQVLQSLTARCSQTLRSYDVMARYGGEEFIVMLPETDAAQAYLVAERLRTTVAETPIETKAGRQRLRSAWESPVSR